MGTHDTKLFASNYHSNATCRHLGINNTNFEKKNLYLFEILKTKLLPSICQ